MDEQIEPERPEALFRIGLSLYNQRRYEEALSYFNRAIAGNSTLGEVWAYRALSRILLRAAGHRPASLAAWTALPSLAARSPARRSSQPLLGGTRQPVAVARKTEDAARQQLAPGGIGVARHLAQ